MKVYCGWVCPSINECLVLVLLAWNRRLSPLGQSSRCDLISCWSSRGMMSSSANPESTTLCCRAPPPHTHIHTQAKSPSRFLYPFLFFSNSLWILLNKTKNISPALSYTNIRSFGFSVFFLFPFNYTLFFIAPSIQLSSRCQKPKGQPFLSSAMGRRSHKEEHWLRVWEDCYFQMGICKTLTIEQRYDQELITFSFHQADYTATGTDLFKLISRLAKCLSNHTWCFDRAQEGQLSVCCIMCLVLRQYFT